MNKIDLRSNCSAFREQGVSLLVATLPWVFSSCHCSRRSHHISTSIR